MTMTYQEEQLLQAATGRAAILDLNARFQLRKIQEVASIDRQVFDLLVV